MDENGEPPPVEEREYAASNRPQGEIKGLASTPAAVLAQSHSAQGLGQPRGDHTALGTAREPKMQKAGLCQDDPA
ncbi:MAG: hypothetical protein M1826_007462 [Phylliscum demangeonii]|nr:MAG: hypothetical protein M1826_007462 [Phylliscum demangeonii]